MTFLIMSGQRAWLAGAEGGEAREVLSPFISDYIKRRERQRELRSWTASSGGDSLTSAYTRMQTWGGRSRPIADVDVQYQAAAPDGNGGFYSAVGFGTVGGLFHQNAQGDERRLFHRDRFGCDGLAFQASQRRFVMATGDAHGPTHLVLLDENGRETRVLTEGDCRDACPAWDPSRSGTVLYQSSGMARRPDGRMEFAPWEAMELDVDKDEIKPLWRRDGMDVLLPRRDSRGRLYALVRPRGDAPVRSSSMDGG